ncbi:Lrp/AsnC family transcriptional regulator [Pectobacterium polaris]|uniref:Lrp/AsnC family transcriptional regulator n=1 Tax=Pectobacterium polaris TaxID=2042057 RepID=UPI003B9717CD
MALSWCSFPQINYDRISTVLLGGIASVYDRGIFLLRELVDDATLSYAELGEKVALSAPATHERVKRLRRDTKNFAVYLP